MPAGCASTRWKPPTSQAARPSSRVRTAACRPGATSCSASCTATPRRPATSSASRGRDWWSSARQWRSDALAPSIAQRVDDQRERRRELPSARVVEVITGEWRTPVLEHALQASRFDMRLHHAFGHIGDAESVEAGHQDLAGGVEHELAFDPYVERASAPLEFPR